MITLQLASCNFQIVYSNIYTNIHTWYSLVTQVPLTHLPLDKMAATLADDILKCISESKYENFD